YSYEMDLYRALKVTCVRKGYMFSRKNIKGSTEAEVNVDLQLLPISEGEHIVLGDIRFVGDADRIMRGSEGSLFLLLQFMVENPNVKIEIQGHVNGPTFKNKKEFIDLSAARAKSVYDFLLVNEIDPSRISYKGFGNSMMIYPDPKGQEQSEANRRVEIKVIGK
ncbi:MAG: OmpA family protein, partial [Bacteroidota bacterium]|nr:OmpA family protein [Bacteroidota bacterium]